MTRTFQDTCNAIIAVITDMIIACLSVYMSVWMRFYSGWFKIPFGTPENVYDIHQPVVFASIVCTYLVARHLKLYNRPQRGFFSGKIPRLLRCSIAVTIVLLVLFSIFRNYLPMGISVGTLLLFTPLLFIGLVIVRGILFKYEIFRARRNPAKNRVLMIGANEATSHLMKCFERDPRLGIKECLVLSLPGDYNVAEGIDGQKIVGLASDYLSVLDKYEGIVQVLVADPMVGREYISKLLMECEKRLIRFNVVPDMFFLLTSSIEIETVEDIPLLGLRHHPLDKFLNRLLKRMVDIVCSLLGLIVLGPVILIFAILVKRESPGPAFFRQERCGYKGKLFTIFKLRSMRQDAEVSSGPVFASEDDPRRTKIGTWLREHNIDELPQLWNVLKGDMSIVGPRPERPVFVDRFTNEINHYMLRHASKPGITGWAQVNGLRGNTSIEDRLKYDLWYLENWSLALDLKIMLRTFFAVKNAY